MPQNEPVGQPASDVVRNASQKPRIYYGLHFYPGVAQYPGLTPTGEPRRLLVTEEAIRNMEPSFAGCPVHVEHTNKSLAEDIAKIDEADGYVVRSFYNEADGKHWVEFIIKSDRGHEAIAKGLRLSNAYRPTQLKDGGVWNSVPYEQEVVSGEFQHLALVEVPRYNESIILTPEEFHLYNKQKLEELARARVRNGSKEKTFMFGLFKKTPVEADSEMLVTLKNGQTMSLEQLVNSFDSLLAKHAGEARNDEPESPETQPTPIMGGAINDEKDAPEGAAESKEEKKEEGETKAEEKKEGDETLADLSHRVEVNGEKLSVGDLVAKHHELTQCMNTLAAHYGKLMAAKNEPPKEEKKEEAPAPEEKKENSAAPAPAAEAKDEDDDFFSGIFGENAIRPKTPDFFSQIKNAKHLAGVGAKSDATQATSGVALGKKRYG